MAHFVEIWTGDTTQISGTTYVTNMVIRVLRVPDEQEDRGEDYLANDLGLGGTWKKTSYNNNIRGKYAGVGYLYNEEYDIFHPQQRFPSWTLNVTNGKWDPPTPKPTGAIYKWDEDTISWVYIGEIPVAPTPSVTPTISVTPSSTLPPQPSVSLVYPTPSISSN